MTVVDREKSPWYLRPALIAIAGLLVVVTAIVLNAVILRDEHAPVAPPPPPTALAPEAVLPVAPLPSSIGFDVVRVNPDGATVMAGRAEPASEVTLRGNGAVLGTVRADNRGDWVFVPANPLAPGAHRLTVDIQRQGEAPITDADSVLILIPQQGEDIAGRKVEQPSLPLAIRPSGDGHRATTVLQTPGGIDDGASGASIETVDYGEKGLLIISGRADAHARVRLFLNDRLIGETKSDGEGRWQLAAREPMATGTLTLRADILDKAGNRTSRLAVPLAITPLVEPPTAPQAIVVEPGQTLWRIARRTYGDGVAYTIIYEANRHQITHPDRIYPGQVFELPPARLDRSAR